MAWAWLAPLATGVSGVAGIVFTWLAGAQGRKHAQYLLAESREADARERLLKERRDAYLAILRIIEISRKCEKYRIRNETEKLRQLDEWWPRSERARMEIEATTALRAFGSDAIQAMAEGWIAARIDGDYAVLNVRTRALRQQVRDELQGETDWHRPSEEVGSQPAAPTSCRDDVSDALVGLSGDVHADAGDQTDVPVPAAERPSPGA
ncbi:hypothetical protein [Nonomuraea typhae]|uniref:hypothetical protein n=1 Tax=Nonomuraea typhae TaxID=2603600 RepID=UPI0012F9829A|nr:hypothetical protein [Nonomuraea typhae]